MLVIFRHSNHFWSFRGHLETIWGHFLAPKSNLPQTSFEFGATNWPQMVPKGPQNDPKIAQNELNIFKVTFKTISIGILLLLWLF